MVNSEEFIKRLQRVMDHNELSASSFAEQIGVQRSSISHLLSGRNKPSLDFVMRVVRTYPEVNLYWLLNGKGEYPSGEQKAAPSPVPDSRPKTPENIPSVKKEAPIPVQGKSGKTISRIIIFYEDGSFESFSKNLSPDS